MNAKEEFLRWKNSGLLTAEELAEMAAIETDADTIALRFGAPMSFGTAGLRSTMYMGQGCMNRFTVAQTTAGIAALVKKEGGEDRGVAIAYDSRNHSAEFAAVCAEVLAAQGIRAYLFDDIRPTPELSFALRELHCMAGINITASHNPKEYNGYKAYWEDGAQISPEQSAIVAQAIAEVDVLRGAARMPLSQAVEKGLVTMLTEDFDERYLAAVEKTAIHPEYIREAGEDLKIVYTPLHGAGRRLVPLILRRMGMAHLYTVPVQMIPDGNFPTVKKPNPEYADVFALGIEIAKREGSDLIIATDPDADRVGVMSRKGDGSFATITGNQMGALLLDYVIRARREAGLLLPGAFAVKSIVSTDLAAAIAEKQGVLLYDVFTGFKFIGEVIKRYEAKGQEDRFLCGFEESYGYLFGTYARDKDAVGATMMIVEMTAYYRKKGMTLSDALETLYRTYGLYREGVLDLYMEGLDGIKRRHALMQNLRLEPPAAFAGVPVCAAVDYAAGTVKDVSSGKVSAVSAELGRSDVLCYKLENGDKIVVRPSGTEPKVKFYFLCHGEEEKALADKVEAYRTAAKEMADKV